MARRFDLLLIVGVLALLRSSPAASQLPRFEDRTVAANISVVTNSGSIEKPHILESTANGVLVLDYDLDGFVDLFFASAYRLPQGSAGEDERSALYRNNGDGTFTDVTAAAGVDVRAYGHGGCVGDFDADGLPDIYLTILGPNILFRNNGDGTFADVTDEAGVGDPGPSIGSTFFDADGDGDQDLFVGNYLEASWEEIHGARRTRRWRGKVTVMDGPRGLEESRNTFYLNHGDGTFEEATESAGLAVGGYGYSMGVTSFDYDNDGDTDLYVANDSNANRLYSNHGDGTFEEIGTWSGTAYNADGRAQGSMGVGFGDFDNNGWLDLVVTNFAHDYYALYRNLSGQLFQDESFVARLTAPSFRPLGWGALFLDVDHDRDLDLFFANGHIYPQVDEDPSLGETYKQQNQLLLNEDGGFLEITEQAGGGLLVEESSRGAAYLDMDNDGDLDIVVSNQDAVPTLLANLTDTSNHWLMVDLTTF
ncbi:MAG: VCBS repeat-containing protein, partial [Thermoanaerobaculia bacterium]